MRLYWKLLATSICLMTFGGVYLGLSELTYEEAISILSIGAQALLFIGIAVTVFLLTFLPDALGEDE